MVWKTVHTVFFNELDFLPEESPVNSGFPHPGVMEQLNNSTGIEDLSCTTSSTKEKPDPLCGVQPKDAALAEEDVVVYLSDNDEPSPQAVSRLTRGTGDRNVPSQGPRRSGDSKSEELICASKPKRLHVQEDSLVQVEKDIPLSTKSSLESFKHFSDETDGGHEPSADGQKSSQEDESVDEEGGEDDKLVPADDIFSAHFDSLSSDVKVLACLKLTPNWCYIGF